MSLALVGPSSTMGGASQRRDYTNGTLPGLPRRRPSDLILLTATPVQISETELRVRATRTKRL